MENDKLKIVFVGMPDMATICLENLVRNKFQIVAVIPPSKKSNSYPFFKEFAISKGLNFIEFDKTPNETECIEKIKKLNADIGVCCSYNLRFSKEFLKTTKLGYLNCHPSLLPSYRGAMPYFHIVKNNEKTSGITIHFMDETFDTGDIVYQEKFDLTQDETMGTIFNRTTYMLSDALVKVLSELETKKELKRYPQGKENYKDAPRVDGNFRIRWNQKPKEIECLIRACNPFYTPFCYFRGVGVKIIKAKAIEKKHNEKYGKIVKANQKELIISAKDGFLSIEILSIGTWGCFTAESFYNTFKPSESEYLD